MTLADRIRAEALAALSAAADVALLDHAAAPASTTAPEPTWDDLTLATRAARAMRVIDEMTEQHVKNTTK